MKRPRAKRTGTKTRASSVSLEALVTEGLLRPPIRLMAQYRGQSLVAMVQPDGGIYFEGTRYASPSTAAAMARKTLHDGAGVGQRPPPTNGWTFWRLQDPASNELVPLSAVRERYRQRKRAEAERASASEANQRVRPTVK